MISLSAVYKGIAGVVVVALAIFLYSAHERSVGALDAKLSQAETQVHALSKTADSLENLFRVDTVVLTKRITKIDTILQHLIDTAVVHHHDTVTVTREVLVQADSTIRYCKAVLSECSAGWTAEKGINASLRAELTATQAKVPSAFGNVVRGLAWGLAGYGLRAVVAK